MKTLSEHNYDQHQQHMRVANDEWQKIRVTCNDCGAALEVNTTVILTSIPPQKYVRCPRCGKVDYMVV